MPGTTPVYGFPYPEPTDLVADYPALGQQLAQDVEDVLPGLGGLAPVAPTSIANSGGSASTTANTTTFTGVTSISLNGVFSATYDHYRILVRATGSTTLSVNMRLRAAGTDAATNYNRQRLSVVSTTISGSVSASATEFFLTQVTTLISGVNAELFSPFTAAATVIQSQSSYSNAYTTPELWLNFGNHSTATSYDGFSLLASTGNMTGTVSVFGYRK